MTRFCSRIGWSMVLAATLPTATALAQAPVDDPEMSPGGPGLVLRTLSFAQDPPVGTDPESPPPLPLSVEETHRYREISDFFNVREAYPSVEAGEWEFEAWFEWDTGSGRDDNFGPIFSLKYGFSDTLFLEVELEQIVLGDGGDQGNGELELILFKQWWSEADVLPAFATWGELRLPSGEGSSGVDVDLHFTLTKELLPDFRAHLDGFVESANGARGGDSADDRRNFQWGVGPGLDYSFSEDTIGVVNYLIRSSEEEGHQNQSILEFGAAQRIADNQHLKFAIDIGLDGGPETPDFAAKILWSIEW